MLIRLSVLRPHRIASPLTLIARFLTLTRNHALLRRSPRPGLCSRRVRDRLASQCRRASSCRRVALLTRQIPHGQKLAKFCGAWESGCKAYAEKNYKRNIVEKVRAASPTCADRQVTPNCEHNPSSTKLATVECLVSVRRPSRRFV